MRSGTTRRGNSHCHKPPCHLPLPSYSNTIQSAHCHCCWRECHLCRRECLQPKDTQLMVGVCGTFRVSLATSLKVCRVPRAHRRITSIAPTTSRHGSDSTIVYHHCPSTSMLLRLLWRTRLHHACCMGTSPRGTINSLAWKPVFTHSLRNLINNNAQYKFQVNHYVINISAHKNTNAVFYTLLLSESVGSIAQAARGSLSSSSSSSSSWSSSSAGSGVPYWMARLWSTMQAVIILVARTGAYRISVRRQWKRRFRTPMHRSTVARVLVKAVSYRLSAAVRGFRIGVSSQSRSGYPLSPRMKPSSLG